MSCLSKLYWHCKQCCTLWYIWIHCIWLKVSISIYKTAKKLWSYIGMTQSFSMDTWFSCKSFSCNWPIVFTFAVYSSWGIGRLQAVFISPCLGLFLPVHSSSFPIFSCLPLNPFSSCYRVNLIFFLLEGSMPGPVIWCWLVVSLVYVLITYSVSIEALGLQVFVLLFSIIMHCWLYLAKRHGGCISNGYWWMSTLFSL